MNCPQVHKLHIFGISSTSQDGAEVCQSRGNGPTSRKIGEHIMALIVKTWDAHFTSAFAHNRAGQGPRHTERKKYSSVSWFCLQAVVDCSPGKGWED